MGVFYNDNEPFIAKWLAELVAHGHLPPGDLETRSIKEIDPAILADYAHCHFFAGIGGWPLALDMAGWPSDRRVWTMSCPCQPFSAAGKRQGTSDPRHLWPDVLRLIAECRPPTIFGEQVASKDGRLWLAGVRADLEALGYAVGAADLCAAGVGAPHIRQRLYWVANSAGKREREPANEAKPITVGGETWAVIGSNGEPLAYPDSESAFRSTVSRRECNPWSVEPAVGRVVDGVPHSVVAPYLAGYGNSLVPQVAAEFVAAYLDTERQLGVEA